MSDRYNARMARKKPRKRPYVQPPHEVENRKERPAGETRRPTRRQQPELRDSKGRRVRPVEPPSWKRSIRRAPLVFVLFFGLQYFLSGSLGATSDLSTEDRLIRAAFQGIFMTVLFVPLSYYMDRFMYRFYLRKTGQQPEKDRRREQHEGGSDDTADAGDDA